MELAPILLFTYNRLEHTKRTVEALKSNELAADSELYVYSDAAGTAEAAGKVAAVRQYLGTIHGFRKIHIIEREVNFGLGKNIIDGVSTIISQKGKVIVLEDDLTTSPYFLRYMNEGLTTYENNPAVISIHGYLYPVKIKMPDTFFIRNADCWGWATWKRGWDLFESDGTALLKRLSENNLLHSFDFDGSYPFTQMLRDQVAGKNSSWAVRWYASAFLNEKYTLYPGKSLVYHAGNDGTGTHSGFDSLLNVELSQDPIHVTAIKVGQDIENYNAFVKFYRNLTHPTILYRLGTKLKRIFAR